MRRTKIIATLGPSTNTTDRIAELIATGMDVARLNFSHGTHADHAARIAMVRTAAVQVGRFVAILQDLQGPKIRTGPLVNKQPVTLVNGQTFTLTIDPIEGDAQRVSTTYEMLPRDVRPGDYILLSDGLIELRVIARTNRDVTTEVIHGGRLRENQGINLPGVDVSAPAITPKDIEDLHFGLEHDVDYVALSFVRRASDVEQVKDIIAQAGKDTQVVAKIERPEALDELPEILEVADAIMVARGDLGVELPPAQVPIVQKQMIEAANCNGTPVITATQMLESMIQNPRPTRAEVSDVANAIIDGTDAVMLSGETAAGNYPIEAVRMMALIAEIAETSGRHSDKHSTPRWAMPEIQSIPWAIGAATSAIVKTIPIRAIAVFTQSGSTARIISHFRPEVPIVAFTPSERICRRMCLLWGVTPIQTKFVDRLDELEKQVQLDLLQHGYAQVGDSVVITGGHPTYARGQTNFLKISTL